jgi:adhesin transport system outer membrane protein
VKIDRAIVTCIGILLVPLTAHSQTNLPGVTLSDLLKADRTLAPRVLAKELSQGDPSSTRLDASLPSTPLELNQAVQIAVDRHPSISEAVSTLAQAAGGVAVARAGYFPQVTTGLGNGNNTLTGSGKTASVTVSQMIYDFGKVSGAVDQAKAGVKRQQATVLKQIQSIEQQTAEAVVNVHRYQMMEGIAAEQVSAVEKVYEMTRLRSDAGVSTRSDPIQAETRVQSAKANLLQVRSLGEQARQKLRTLLGGPIVNGVAPLPDAQIAQVSFAETPETDLMPDVLIAQADVVSARDQVSIAKSQRLPTLSVNASINKNITGINPSTFQRNGSDRTVMLNLSWAAFQGGALNAQVNAANNALAAARSRVETARLDGSDQARVFREQAIGAQSRIAVLGERKKSITEARDLYREQYKLGTRSVLDLLNAEQEFYQAASDEEAIRHDYWNAVVDYVAATGKSNDFYGLKTGSVQGMEMYP